MAGPARGGRERCGGRGTCPKITRAPRLVTGVQRRYCLQHLDLAGLLPHFVILSPPLHIIYIFIALDNLVHVR